MDENEWIQKEGTGKRNSRKGSVVTEGVVGRIHWLLKLVLQTKSGRQKKSNSEVICGRSSLSGRQRGGWDGMMNHEGQKNDSDT